MKGLTLSLRSPVTAVCVALFATVSVAWTPSAQACSASALACYGAGVVKIPAAVTVPGNTPGIPFSPGDVEEASKDQGEVIDVDVDSIVLKDADGVIVPTSLQSLPAPDFTKGYGPFFQRLLVPSQPLAPGSYSLTFANPCAEAPWQETRTFNVGPVVSLPTEVGTARAISLGVGEVIQRGGSMCVTTSTRSRISIEFTKSPGLSVFEAIADISVFVDGKLWGGPVPNYSGAGYPTNVDHFTLFGRCGDQLDEGLAEGKHTVEVRAHIDGAAVDPAPATVEVEVTCPSSTALTTEGASPQTEDSTSPGEASSSSCSMLPGRTSHGVLELVGAGVAAAALFTHRKRRR